jgi:serine/threonine protein kinase
MFGYFTFPNATCLILEYALGSDLEKLANDFYRKILFKNNNRYDTQHEANTTKPVDKNTKPEAKPQRKIWIDFMSEDLIRYFIYKIASSLAYLKTLNLVHLDLCLKNIFLTKNFNVKLGDYGGSKLIKQGENFKYEVKPSCLTVFVPPECLTNKSISNDDAYKIDIYSMGVIMFKLLTNKYPLSEEMLKIKDEKGNVDQDKVQKIKEKLSIEGIKKSVEEERGETSKELIDLIADSMNYEERTRIDIYRFLRNQWLLKDFERIEGNL